MEKKKIRKKKFILKIMECNLYEGRRSQGLTSLFNTFWVLKNIEEDEKKKKKKLL